jgi:membrane dipeptidase
VRFFDAHCDTVTKVEDGTFDFLSGEGKGHVSFPGLVEAGSCGQVFACFVLSERHPRRERERAEEVIAAIQRMIADTRGGMALALTASDLRAGLTDGPLPALVALEGADPLEGDPEAFAHFHRLGVRNLILAWKDNPFSGSAFGTDTPLTPAGERLVGLAEELGTMVDVSHLSDRAFADVCRRATRPFIASHSNCRALCPSPRNLTDAMIRALADRGGVIGINLVPPFLDPVFHAEAERHRQEVFAGGATLAASEEFCRRLAALSRPSLDWVGRHVLHAIEVGGEDAVGLGGDLDGTDLLPQGIEGIRDYPVVADLLFQAGLSTSQVEKVAWRNFLRVFSEVLPD